MMNNKKGFTLIEVIVAVALFMVVVGVSLSFIMSGSGIFSKSADMTHASRMAQYTLDWFEDNMVYASKVTLKNVTANPAAAPSISLKITETGTDSKKLLNYKTPGGPWVDQMGKGFYENLGMGIYMTPKSAKSLELKVSIRNREDKEIYAVSKVFVFTKNLQTNGIVDERTNKTTPYNLLVIENNVAAPTSSAPSDSPTHKYFYVKDGTNYYRICSKGNWPTSASKVAGDIFWDTANNRYVVFRSGTTVSPVNTTINTAQNHGNIRINTTGGVTSLQIYAGSWIKVDTSCAL